MRTITQAETDRSPAPKVLLSASDFDGDEDDWYIMLRAHELGLDPHEMLLDVRAAQRRMAGAREMTTKSVGIGNPSAPLNISVSALDFPPGFAGQIAQFIYDAAPRPVAEVAVVGALGLLAGICGREWNISATGLNIYVVLIARSGIGKEALHQGISKLVGATKRAGFLAADEFVCFDDFVSGPALVKTCLQQQCFVNVAGEIGHKFRMMADDRDPASRSLRKQMTTLYSKSGRDNVAGGLVYSNAESNVASVSGVAFSLVGESTPGLFFESVTRGMMEDGYMSRFNVVEYTGDRPDKNPTPAHAPEPPLVKHLLDLMTHSQTLRHQQRVQNVEIGGSARSILEAFDSECDDQIRGAGDDESRRQMWNRAHLKALRISALLAVGDNHLFPKIDEGHARWAIGLVRADIGVFGKRIERGDVGIGSDDGREARILQLCCDYIVMTPSDVPNFAKKWEDVRRAGLVPRSYLQIMTQRVAAFEKHQRGHKAALDTALQTAMDNGRLMPISTATAATHYKLGFRGKLYAIMEVD